MRTIELIDQAGQDIRVWCFRCARGDRIDAIIWMQFAERGWTQELPAASRHFRCSSCRLVDQVLVVPARRPDVGFVDGTRVVTAYFHALRSGKKKRR